MKRQRKGERERERKREKERERERGGGGEERERECSPHTGVSIYSISSDRLNESRSLLTLDAK